MKRFQELFLLQTKIHDSFTPRDGIKLCYQAAFGPGHMLCDPQKARAYLHEECNALFPKEEPLYEEISEQLVRINLGPWVKQELSLDWLFSLFRMTAELPGQGEAVFYNYISAVRELSVEGQLPFSLEEFDAQYEDYISGGIRAVSHSQEYRIKNAPAYRLVAKQYLNLIPVLKYLNQNPDVHVISIDGMAGSGKTTLANQLKTVLSCSLISMDDFFLPLDLRTAERLNETGGNIHYERFLEEVISHIRENKAFSYRKFDCSTMDYAGNVLVTSVDYRIIEGSYSHHPYFGDYADLRIFVETDARTQMNRISARNIPDWMVQKFRDSWIPMENRYHKEHKVRDGAHIVITT